MEEYFFKCPFCFTEVSVMVDLSVKKQEYVEDCERCCNPLEFTFETDGERVISSQLGEVI